MQFRYKVITEEMHVRDGTVGAIDLEAARQLIVNNRWQIISLSEVKEFENLLTKPFQGRVSYEAIAAFCTQLALIVRSGVNLVRGLEMLQTQMQDHRLRQVIGVLHTSVSRGASLSSAMKECKGALPDLLINLVAVGEESGNLDSVLTSLAAYYDRENFIRKKISSAAIYPVILSVVLIGLVIFFMNFILPEISDLITSNGQSLPFATQVVVDSAHFLQRDGWILLLGVIAFSLLLRTGSKIPKYRFFMDGFLLKIPVIGKNLHNVITSRFSRSLALFLHSSIPIIPIFEYLEDIVGNEVPRRSLRAVKERIVRGETMNGAFSQEKFFDPLFIQMMAIGEETGRLEELMVEVSNHYDKLVEIGITRMVALIEPVFTIIVGVFAGAMIVSIALPILTMASSMK